MNSNREPPRPRPATSAAETGTGAAQEGANRRRRPSPTPIPVRRSLSDLGRAIATWRRLRGLTQAQLADRAAVSLSTAKRLEQGDGGITTENFLRVLRALGVLELLPRALDPYESDVGRLRADEQLPQRVRPRRLTGSSRA
jgi:transcriptional regulator with XRE-family HTH domain